jgi:hypothetical protein
MSDVAQFVSSLNLSRFAARLRVERDPTTRSSLHRLLIEEASNLALSLGQLGSLQREVIAGRARIAIQIAVVETLAANGQDARLAESTLCDLIEVQKTIERYHQGYRRSHGPESRHAQGCQHEPRLQEGGGLKGRKE